MNTIEVKFFRVGHCSHLECISQRGGRWKTIEFPAYCGLIVHPVHGAILFDTGYANHFFIETQEWPEVLYRTLLPVQLKPEELLLEQLKAIGISPQDINTVVISHYHGDHIAGLRDFPKAKFIASKKDTQLLISTKQSRLRATCKGLLHRLLPGDFYQKLQFANEYRVVSLPPWMHPFRSAYDCFGDNSVLLIPLPGHSPGQLGMLIPESDHGPVFFSADACWSLPACEQGILPSRIADLIHFSSRDYHDTFFRLQTLINREKSLSVLPSHCSSSWERFHHLWPPH